MRRQLAVQAFDRELAPCGTLRERFGNLRVKLRARRMRLRLVECLANEWMRENERLIAACQKTRVFGLIEQVHDLFGRAASQQRQELRLKLVTDYGADGKYRVGRLRESRQSAAQYLTDSWRYGEAWPFALEQPQVRNFLHEEWIATGSLVHLAHEGSRSNTPHTFNKRVSAVRIQTAKWDPLNGRRQIAQQVRCSFAQLQWIVPSGQHEHRG
jgi:hypothetical protein